MVSCDWLEPAVSRVASVWCEVWVPEIVMMVLHLRTGAQPWCGQVVIVEAGVVEQVWGVLVECGLSVSLFWWWKVKLGPACPGLIQWLPWS